MTMLPGFEVVVSPEWEPLYRCPKGHTIRYRNAETGQVWEPVVIRGEAACALCIAQASGLRCTRMHLVGFSVDNES